MLYQCPYCNNIHSNEEWNNRTKQRFRKIITVERATSETFFICPSCVAWVDFPDMIKLDLSCMENKGLYSLYIK